MRPQNILATAATLSLAWTPAEAQCNLPDGLDFGPCCTPVQLNLPAFPKLMLPAQGDCWNACGLTAQNCLRVSVGTPGPGAQCSQYRAPLEVFDCAGTSIMKGTLTLDYTRTWNEFPLVGAAPIQVWRFAAKVDLLASSTAAVCPVPPCAFTTHGSFFYGYIDYALDCSTNLFEGALVLFHNCDAFIHDQPWSSNPGTSHPGTTYAIVAPDTAANPFVPVATPPLAGPVMAEAMRKVTPTPDGGPCLAEEPILQGVFLPLAFGCFCPLGFFPGQNSVTRFSGRGACGSGFTSINVWPFVPWFELVTTTIGRWSSPSAYPGPEEAHVAEGLFSYKDTCGAPAPQNHLDVFYGGITEGGFLVAPVGPVGAGLTQRFIDLASNFSQALPGVVTPPLVGTVDTTDHLIYANF